MYDPHVHIHASAPTRIDLAGGTLDIWPLYLFHEGAQTLNAAISLRASCDLRSRNDRRLVIVSEDSEQRVEVDHWTELRDNHDLRLLGRLLQRQRWIAYVGLAIIVYVAVEMIYRGSLELAPVLASL